MAWFGYYPTDNDYALDLKDEVLDYLNNNYNKTNENDIKSLLTNLSPEVIDDMLSSIGFNEDSFVLPFIYLEYNAYLNDKKLISKLKECLNNYKMCGKDGELAGELPRRVIFALRENFELVISGALPFVDSTAFGRYVEIDSMRYSAGFDWFGEKLMLYSPMSLANDAYQQHFDFDGEAELVEINLELLLEEFPYLSDNLNNENNHLFLFWENLIDNHISICLNDDPSYSHCMYQIIEQLSSLPFLSSFKKKFDDIINDKLNKLMNKSEKDREFLEAIERLLCYRQFVGKNECCVRPIKAHDSLDYELIIDIDTKIRLLYKDSLLTKEPYYALVVYWCAEDYFYDIEDFNFDLYFDYYEALIKRIIDIIEKGNNLLQDAFEVLFDVLNIFPSSSWYFIDNFEDKELLIDNIFDKLNSLIAYKDQYPIISLLRYAYDGMDDEEAIEEIVYYLNNKDRCNIEINDNMKSALADIYDPIIYEYLPDNDDDPKCKYISDHANELFDL